MTYEEIQNHRTAHHLRTPPWPDQPGEYLCQLHPAGTEDPIIGEFSSMMAAILHASTIWKRHHGKVKLRVTSKDGSEIFVGQLLKI